MMQSIPISSSFKQDYMANLDSYFSSLPPISLPKFSLLLITQLLSILSMEHLENGKVDWLASSKRLIYAGSSSHAQRTRQTQEEDNHKRSVNVHQEYTCISQATFIVATGGGGTLTMGKHGHFSKMCQEKPVIGLGFGQAILGIYRSRSSLQIGCCQKEDAVL